MIPTIADYYPFARQHMGPYREPPRRGRQGQQVVGGGLGGELHEGHGGGGGEEGVAEAEGPEELR